MKYSQLLLLLCFLCISMEASQRICKTQVLRSFGLQSRITPSSTNSLCPEISYNCCTKRDQMKIHKTWNQVNREFVQSTYRTSRDSFDRIGSILLAKDDFQLRGIVDKFKTAFKPHDNFINHLVLLVGEYNKRDAKFFSTLMKQIRPKITTLHNELAQYRQSLFCTLCNYSTHTYFNPQSMTLQYDQRFCLENLVAKYIDLLSDKYGEIFRLMAVMDEFMFLISGQRLLKVEDSRTFLHYIAVINKCRTDSTKINACADVCREFNINKFTYMWDGEPVPINDFLDNYDRFWAIMNDNEKLNRLFMFRAAEWTHERLSQFISTESVMANWGQLSQIGLRKNTFELNFKSSNVKNFYEYKHPTNTVQIETLDEELSSYALYKMIDPPIDVSKFMIVFEPSAGLNPSKDSEKMNFNISVDELLALLHSSGTDIKALNEVVDKAVSTIMLDISITDIADFINNPYIEFARIVRKTDKTISRPRGLNQNDGQSGVAVFVWHCIMFLFVSKLL